MRSSDMEYDSHDCSDYSEAEEKVAPKRCAPRVASKPKAKKARKGGENHVPRPMNAFMIFSKGRREEIRRENPNLHNAIISERLGQEWTKLAADKKKGFYSMAEQQKEEHRKLYPDYKYEPKRKKATPVAKPKQQKTARAKKDFRSTLAVKKYATKSRATRDLAAAAAKSVSSTVKSVEVKVRITASHMKPTPAKCLPPLKLKPVAEQVSPVSSDDGHALTVLVTSASRNIELPSRLANHPTIAIKTEMPKPLPSGADYITPPWHADSQDQFTFPSCGPSSPDSSTRSDDSGMMTDEEVKEILKRSNADDADDVWMYPPLSPLPFDVPTDAYKVPLMQTLKENGVRVGGSILDMPLLMY